MNALVVCTYVQVETPIAAGRECRPMGAGRDHFFHVESARGGATSPAPDRAPHPTERRAR